MCDEILICGSAEEVTPVVAVDRLKVGDGTPGPITTTLQRLFFAAARGDDPAFADSVLGHRHHAHAVLQCVTMFTEALPWRSGRDLELVTGRAVCDWLGWKR